MRGDVFRLSAPRNTRGHEQQGRRYAVVVQDDDFLSLSTWMIAPTSTSAHAATFRPTVDVNGERTRVLVEQTSAVDPSRLGERAGHLSFNELKAVNAALRLILSL